MKQWKRLFYYLLINVFVSACTTLLVLSVWDQLHSTAAPLAFGSISGKATTLPAEPSSSPDATQALQTGLPPLAPATSTPTPKPTDAVLIITVMPDQTLGEIAQEYNVDLDYLVQFNQLPDPNQISVGMQVFIPVTPEVIPTSTPTSTPTINLTPGDTPGPQAEAQVIISSVIGVGDAASEHVFLTRTGSGELSLSGWTLSDEDGNVFTFPQLQLFEGGAVNVWTTTGTPTVVDLYWGLSSAVWSSGEKAVLKDASGKVRATYTVP